MSGESVLIVEDEGLIALHLSELLENHGFHVLGTPYSGEASLHMIQKSRPDLVLMDIALAGPMDGIEAARRIRHQHDIPVIFLSAFSDQNRIAEAAGVSPYGFLIKPVLEDQLMEAIGRALARRQR
jgi:DNA-binding NarL/FixJ family response regulator